MELVMPEIKTRRGKVGLQKNITEKIDMFLRTRLKELGAAGEDDMGAEIACDATPPHTEDEEMADDIPPADALANINPLAYHVAPAPARAVDAPQPKTGAESVSAT